MIYNASNYFTRISNTFRSPLTVLGGHTILITHMMKRKGKAARSHLGAGLSVPGKYLISDNKCGYKHEVFGSNIHSYRVTSN